MDWIFWDNDGVLVATEELYFQACAEALARAGVILALADFQDLSLRQGASVFALLPAAFGADEREALRQWRDARYGELLATGTPLMPGVKQTLAALHGRVRMAIVTSCRREHFRLMHRNSGLLDYFDFILVRENYRLSKPDPEPYRPALQRSGAVPERCLVVEDSPRGAAAAAGAGLPCLVIPGALNAGSDFSGARWQVETLEEIPSILGY